MSTTHSDFAISMMTGFFLMFMFTLGVLTGYHSFEMVGEKLFQIYLLFTASIIGTVLTYYSPQIMYLLKEGR